MLIDAGVLVRPLSAEAPCGPNLEHDPVFQELEALVKVTEGAEPEWKAVAAKAAELLKRSLDIRPLSLLCRAGLHLEGIEAFAGALATLDGYLEGHWDGVHPQLEGADEEGAMMRLNAIAAFADGPTMLKSLRDATLIRSRAFGDISFRKIEIARGRQPRPANGSPPLTDQQIEAAFTEAGAAAILGQLSLVRAAVESARTVERTLNDKLGEANALSLKELLTLLGGIATELAAQHDKRAAGAVPAAGAGNGAVAGAPRAEGPIASRQDVIRALEQCCDYFREHEPSSPVPLLLQRAKRLAAMDFLSIVRDLSPQAVQQLESVVGKQSETEKKG